MRTFAIVLVTFVLAAGSTVSVSHAEARKATPLEFLLNSAASDFHEHTQPAPDRFRDVRLGHFKTESGEVQYFLCGEFLPARESGKAKWTKFATIQTSGYEQWIGGQSQSFCRHSGTKWEGSADLSPSLQIRLEALRGPAGK
ncbi:MAG: hypothetical protein ABI639_14100 [Thermoanaerobaculia bacterium]